MTTGTKPTLADIETARERLAGKGVRVTPVYSSETFARLIGRPIHLKAETLQRTGSFKIRGAVNKIEGPERRRAQSRRRRGQRGEPRPGGRLGRAGGGDRGDDLHAGRDADGQGRADAELRRACRAGGGDVRGCARPPALAHVEETGGTFLHPFEDPEVIAGQGTIGLELAEQLPELETVVVPIGGGGLASGIGLALQAVRPEVKIVGVQAAACAPLAGGTDFGFTIAEGIAVKHPGELTSGLLGDLLDGIVTVTDEEISEAIVLLMERAKLVVEGAGAAAVAALVAGRIEGEGPAVAILSGGNIDPTLLIQVMRHGLTLAGRYLVVRTRLPDRPGELIKLLSLFAEERANVVSIEHHREGMDVPVTETEVEATL